MLGFKSLFKARANYVFDYKPRYYDERKERIKKLEQQYANDGEITAENHINLTKEGLQREWKKNKHVAHDRKANLRLAIIITILVGIVFYLFDLHTLF